MDNLYEAYLGVYQEQEIDESRGGKASPGTPDSFHQLSRGVKQKKGVKTSYDKEGNMNRKYATMQLKKRKQAPYNEETDLFDYLLEYLVAEGYADTNDAAIAIMANMSEEWKENILEETKRTEYLQKKFDKENKAKSGSAHTYIPGKQNTGSALYKARQSERHMKGEQ